MARIASLAIDFTTNVAQIANDMTKVQKSVTGTMRTIRNSAIVAGAAAAGIFAKNTITGAMDYAGSIQDLAQQVGFASQSLQELRFIAGENTVSAQEFTGALSKLTVSIGQARQGSKSLVADFAQVGVTVQDLATLSPEQILTKMADGFSHIEGASDRAAIASGIFGKNAGPGMAVMLSQGSAEITRQREELQRYGVVISKDIVDASAKANDKLQSIAAMSKSAFNAGLLEQVQSEFHRFDDAMQGTVLVSRDMGELFGYLSKESIIFGDSIAGAASRVAGLGGGMQSMKLIAVSAISTIKLSALSVEKLLNTTFLAMAKGLKIADTGLTVLINKIPERFGGGHAVDNPTIQNGVANLQAEGAAIDAEGDAILNGMTEAAKNWQAYMAGGGTADLAREYDILGAAMGNVRNELTAPMDFSDDSLTGAAKDLGPNIAEAAKAVGNFKQLQLPSHFEEVGSQMKTVRSEADQMSQAFGGFFDEITRGALNGSLSLESLGNSAMRVFSQIMQSSGIQDRIGGFFSDLFSGGGFGGGGDLTGSFTADGTSFIPSFDAGTNYVKKSGLAMIHEGESIVPAKANRGWSGGGDIQVNVINNFGGEAQVTTRKSQRGGQQNLDIHIDRLMTTKARDPGSYFGGATGITPLTRR